MFLEAPEEWVSQVFVSESFSQDGELMAQVEKYPYEIVKGFSIPSDVTQDTTGNSDSSEASDLERGRCT